MNIKHGKLLQVSVVLLMVTTQLSAVVRRCWSCSSRGEYGDCRDPFAVNPTNMEFYPGANAAPCASGWCGKIIEGDDVQYTVATRRICLPRPPDDNQERCAETFYKNRKVFMCFCMGDLCNSGPITTSSFLVITVAILLHRFFF